MITWMSSSPHGMLSNERKKDIGNPYINPVQLFFFKLFHLCRGPSVQTSVSEGADSPGVYGIIRSCWELGESRLRQSLIAQEGGELTSRLLPAAQGWCTD